MAVALDAFTPGTATTGTSQTFSHTVAGAQRLLLHAVHVNLGTTVTGITYNGVALTKVLATASVDIGNTEIWRLIAPATGSNSCVVSLDSSAAVQSVAISLTGVDQTTPVSGSTGDIYTGNGTSHSHSTTSINGGFVWDAFTFAPSVTGFAVVAGQTLAVGATAHGGSFIYMESYKAATTTSTTTGWTWNADGGLGDFGRWSHATVAIAPAVSGLTPSVFVRQAVKRARHY